MVFSMRSQPPPETPLLLVLRDELGLSGPRFGCGLEQCGACKVMRGAEAVASCRLPVSEAVGAQITTLERLGTPEEPHPVQQAFLEEQAPHLHDRDEWYLVYREPSTCTARRAIRPHQY